MMKYNSGMLTRRTIRIYLCGVILMFITVGALGACSRQGEETKKLEKPSVSVQPDSAQEKVTIKTAEDWSTAIERVAEQTIPAVVHIEVTEYQEVVNPIVPFENDPFFRYFFGVPRGPKKFKREMKGLGTGMIIDSQGYILTNNHVAGGASKIQVLLANGQEYPAKLVGADPKTDLAVIQISAKEPLPYVTFGDSDEVKVGEWVVAIGQPLGLSQTVTQGIISAKHRTGIMNPSGYQDFLQTDAAINPGNSGGPLLNLQGKVVGINAAIMSQSGGSEGIGFAIPSKMAVYITKQLISRGKVERGWLGISIKDLTPDLAKSFGIESTKGVLIADVVKGGPADKAGMRKGDIVIALNGKAFKDAGALRNDVAVTPIGREAAITVLRNGKKTKFTVKIGNIKDLTKYMSASVKERLGAEFRSVMSKEAERYGLHAQQGVEVTWVDPKGPLGRVGLEVGDIILGINHQPVEDEENLAMVLSNLQPGQRIAVLALDHRTGNRGYIQVVVK